MLRLCWSCLGAVMITGSTALASWGLPLSPGDRIKVFIPEGDEFSGTFDVNLDGNLEIPYLSPQPVVGLEPGQVEAQLTQSLIEGGFFQPTFLRVSVKVLRWAPISVYVSGATFEPGKISINNRSPEELAQQTDLVAGDNPPDRFLTVALRSAGGVMPEADVKAVRLIRGGQERTFDLSGVFTGEPIEDIPLLAGDQLIVPRATQRNNDLVRPTQITPPGIAVYLSNLTTPADSNASSAINSDSTKFPYGARFVQAVVAANCSGGTQSTNAKRFAVLVHTNRLTGETTALKRPIEDLLKKPNDDSINPFLMPGDGVACYDSRVTNVRDIFRVLGDLFAPFSILRNIFR
jgi:polysaccharide biosynthesis/export protein